MKDIIDKKEALIAINEGYEIYATIGVIGEGIQVIKLTKTQIKDWGEGYLPISRKSDKHKTIQIG